MHAYRTHTCGALRASDDGREVRLSGWVHSKRDHGGLLFIDLRDHYGMTQLVLAAGSAPFAAAEAARPESVVTATGRVVLRQGNTVNPKLPTGEIEIVVDTLAIQSEAAVLPMQVAGAENFPDELRLRYRYLDLRRDRVHRNMVLRAQIIASIRRRMIEAGFTEFQTPILTASSPEGARDFLVPARMHPGKFYALPQAPQQFKQLLMVAGFDRYFQIAPCFRDEASRADRSPGEFYQLDFEMSFVTQDDVFATIEPVMTGVFEEFAASRTVDGFPYVRIPYDTALLEYGSDKPDLRNPLRVTDVTAHFAGGGFGLFAKITASGGLVRAIRAPGAGPAPAASTTSSTNGPAPKAPAASATSSSKPTAPKARSPKTSNRTAAKPSASPARPNPATPSSSPPASARTPQNSPAPSAPAWARNSASSSRTRSDSAGSPIFRCTK